MEKFLELTADILEVEVEEITMATDFRKDIEDWDSMKGFSIICMLEDDFDTFIDVPEFLECITVEDLFKKINNK